MRKHVSRGFLAVVLALCGEWSMASIANAQDNTPDYRRPSFGARGVGTGDWVFVPPLRSVFQRPRPDYDASGIRLGSWVLSPELGVAGGYDDNVFAEDDNTNDDFFGSATPAFRLRSDWPVHLLGVEGAARFTQYLDETSENAEEARGSIFGRLDITQDDALFASASYRREVQTRGDPEDEGGEQTDFNRWIGRVGYTHQFARMHLRIGGEGQRYDYLDAADDDRDRNELDVGARLTYALSPRFTPFVQAGYGIADFDDAIDDTGVDRDQTQYSALIGGRVLITELLLAELAGGISYTDFDDPALDEIVSPVVSGELIWNPTTLTSIIAHAFRRERPTTQAGAAGRVDTGGGLRLEHELLSNLLVFGEAEYRNEDFTDTDRNDNRIRAGLGGEFLLNNYVSFFAEYSFEHRASNAADEDFTRNIGLVGARFQY